MKVTSYVKQALASNKQARNSDKILLLQVWHSLGLDLTPAQTAKFLELPTPETIRRVRQKLQESGLYPADDTITDARNFMGLQAQQSVPSASIERLETLIQGELV